MGGALVGETNSLMAWAQDEGFGPFSLMVSAPFPFIVHYLRVHPWEVSYPYIVAPFHLSHLPLSLALLLIQQLSFFVKGSWVRESIGRPWRTHCHLAQRLNRMLENLWRISLMKSQTFEIIPSLRILLHVSSSLPKSINMPHHLDKSSITIGKDLNWEVFKTLGMLLLSSFIIPNSLVPWLMPYPDRPSREKRLHRWDWVGIKELQWLWRRILSLRAFFEHLYSTFIPDRESIQNKYYIMVKKSYSLFISLHSFGHSSPRN